MDSVIHEKEVQKNIQQNSLEETKEGSNLKNEKSKSFKCAVDVM
jgi:hypothetical protein